jgi:hypothetical protein
MQTIAVGSVVIDVRNPELRYMKIRRMENNVAFLSLWELGDDVPQGQWIELPLDCLQVVIVNHRR